YTRKWDQQFAPSICVHCGLGCNTDVGEHSGTVRRIVNRYNQDVNGYFLCDRGRFGYEFVNSEHRIREPLFKGKVVSADTASRQLRDMLVPGKTIGIGSPRASLESNFALRTLVGPDRFYSGMADSEAQLVGLAIDILRRNTMRTPTLHEVEASDAVLILGEDVTNVAPRMALALRQSVRQQPIEIAKKLKIPLWMDHGVRDAIQDRRGPLYIATPSATRLDEIAVATFHAAPDDIARLGFAVAHALDPQAPSQGDFPLADEIARALKDAKNPLVIAGPSCNSEAIIQAAANVAMAVGAQLSFTTPECNTVGAVLMGGNPLSAAFQAVKDGDVDTLIILENDLYRRASRADVEALLNAAAHVIVLDHLVNPMTEHAELVLPSGTFAESDGTFISSEGRAQRFFQAFVPDGAIEASWRWLGRESWENLAEVLAAMATALPQLAPARDAAPPATFRMAGAKVPRSPHRASGRTAILANITISEPKPPDDPDSPLSFSMEGTSNHPPGSLLPFVWSPGWNSIQATNTYQKEIGGPLHGGDPGVRMFEPAPSNGQSYYLGIPSAFKPHEDEWLLVSMYGIFGSEELSLSAPGIAELATPPHVAVNADNFTEDQEVEVRCANGTFRLPVRIRPDLPYGVAGLFAGASSIAGLGLPAWGKILRIS
ncbi:MAG: molybdopterin-dependent oxidoreductase, partial [Nitrospirota bacterium]